VNLKGHVRHMTRGWWCGLARLDPSTRRVDGFSEHHVYGSGDVGINKRPPQPITTFTPYIRSSIRIRRIPHTTRVWWRGLRLRAPSFPSCQQHHHHTPSLFASRHTALSLVF